MFERWDAEQTEWVKRQSGLVAPEASDFHALNVNPYSVTEHHGNLITTAGWVRLLNLAIASGSPQALSATAVRIGVGNSSTAAAISQTDLSAASGSTNRFFQPVSGAGTLATGDASATEKVSFAATFGINDGNFAWAEFGLDVGTPTVTGGTTVNALLLNRAVSNQGTKVVNQTWAATAAINFT